MKPISYLFSVPALLVYALFFLYPTLRSFYFALTDWDGLTRPSYIGFDNFRELLDNSRFLASFRNTIEFAVGLTVGQLLLGLLLALMLNRQIRFRSFYRMFFFTPQVISLLAIGYLAMYIFSPLNGTLNVILQQFGLDSWQRDWLGDPSIALRSVITVSIWQGAGYCMMVFLANLQSIPDDLYEASDIDGANSWRKFLHVTLPMLAPSMTICLIIGMIAGLNAFDLIMSMTKGGPGYATDTISSVLYDTMITYQRYGEATAMGIVSFLCILIVSLVQLRLLRRWEVY